MKRLLYALHDQLIIWMLAWSRRYGSPTRPRWVQWLWCKLMVSFNLRTFVPKLIAAQEAGIGTIDGWADPSTPPPEVLAWFDTHVASAPAPFASTDRIRVGLVRVTEAEWEHGVATGEIALTGERVLVEWEGLRSAWEQGGRSQLIAAIPPAHDGLYGVVNGLGWIVQAALQPQHVSEDADDVAPDALPALPQRR